MNAEKFDANRRRHKKRSVYIEELWRSEPKRKDINTHTTSNRTARSSRNSSITSDPIGSSANAQKRSFESSTKFYVSVGDGEYLFPRAKVKTFDSAIARACRKAAKPAKINYGQANGFTCHSFRHTFVTDMMEATGNDVALVMSYSGHRSLESFRTYLHPTREGSILAKQRMSSVGELLGTFAGTRGTQGTRGTKVSSDKSLKIKNIAS